MCSDSSPLTFVQHRSLLCNIQGEEAPKKETHRLGGELLRPAGAAAVGGPPVFDPEYTFSTQTHTRSIHSIERHVEKSRIY